jgi:adenylylsulfate kinase-like enzyme
MLSKHGVFAIAAAISPYRAVRNEIRERSSGTFFEVHIATPLEECARRDVKGLYARAFAGEIANFTGVSDPYEPPLSPELTIVTIGQTPAESAQQVITALEQRGFLERKLVGAR